MIKNNISQTKKFKAIIVLYGTENCGKTQTLDATAKLFSNYIPHRKTRYEVTDNSHKIVICTAGDKEETIISNIKIALELNADIFVTAARISKGRGSAVLNKIKRFTEEMRGCCTITLFLNKEELNLQKISNEYGADHDHINDMISQSIKEIIKQIEKI